MEEYLSKTTELLKAKNYGEMTLVVGNETCDLDSAVSALVYAAYLHWQYMQIKCKVCTKVHRDETMYKDDIFIPLMNIDREDYNLKTEVEFCFKEHGLDETKLVFRNDYDFKTLVSVQRTNVVLVDHHVPAARDQYLLPFVAEVIDHRPVDRDHWTHKDDTRTTLEVTGSCSTLVASRIRGLTALVANKDEFFQSNPTATDLLHCAIILDTVNFSKEVNKATPQDEEMAAYLESILKPSTFFEEARKCKLQQLVAARQDVSQLGTPQLLKKDLKIVQSVLVPSFPILVEEFVQKPAALEAVTEAMSSNGCSMALLLGMCLEDGLKRDGAIFAADPADAAKFLQFLQEKKNPALDLKMVKLPPTAHSSTYLYFKQGCLEASRKQYVQALNEYLQTN